MHWVIQGNVFSEEGWDRLIEALDRQKSSYSIHRCVPFTHDLQPDFEPPAGVKVVVMGTYGLVQKAQVEAWVPGAWNNENFDFRVQVKCWGSLMFNHDSVIVEFGKVPESQDSFFIRPIHDSKDFTGQVCDWPEYETWRENIAKLRPEDGATMDLETLVQVSSVKKIAREYRTWVVDGKVVTACQYKLGRHKTQQPLVDERVVAFAQAVVRRWVPAEAFVLDVFEDVDGKLWIGEVNTLNCSGFYVADMNKVVGAIEEMVARKYEKA